MGVREFKYKLCLNVDLNVILNTAKVWLHTNCFQIKTEMAKPNKAVINSYTGSALFTPFSKESDAKRWLEIHIKLTSKGNYIVLYEKASAWTAGAIKTSLIKDEVLALAAFLQTGCLLSPQHQQQQQQQQIVVNVVSPPPVAPPTPSPVAPVHRTGILCPHCYTPIQNAGAVFCDRCGQRLVWRNLRVQDEDEDKLSVTPASDSVLFCSACDAPLKPNAAFCKGCGAVVENRAQDTESDKEQSADVVLQRVQTKIDDIKDDELPLPKCCSNCGKEVTGADVLFCKYCGSALEEGNMNE
jgi:rRNA maturation endonuclease Nob1